MKHILSTYHTHTHTHTTIKYIMCIYIYGSNIHAVINSKLPALQAIILIFPSTVLAASIYISTFWYPLSSALWVNKVVENPNQKFTHPFQACEAQI